MRRYATEPPKGGSSTVRNLGLVAVAGAVGGAYYLNSAKTPVPATSASKAPAQPKPAFTGGEQGFLSLVLENIEEINHNTKKLRFKLPEEDMTSGLQVACEFAGLDSTWRFH